MENSLIFEGGGVKGIAHVGALKAFEERGFLSHIKHVSGTSAGSHVATLFAAGFTVDEMKEIIENTPFNKFSDSSFGCFRDVWRLFTKYGYHKGEYMEKYVDDILEKKFNQKRITFREMFDITGIHLKLTGTCVSTQQLEWFDYIQTPSMEVCKAVHISSCIPIYYKPVKYNDKYYVDGGCLRNIPSDAFESSHELTPIILDLVSDNEKKNIKNIVDFTSSIVNAMLTHVTDIRIKGMYIKIPTGDISATQFKLGEADKQVLFKSGYDSVKKFHTDGI